jgi:hypothetical protein
LKEEFKKKFESILFCYNNDEKNRKRRNRKNINGNELSFVKATLKIDFAPSLILKVKKFKLKTHKL